CPNAIPEPNFSLLAGKGLPVDVNATGSHPHPAAKAVEEDLLRTLSFSLRDDTTVYFMKQEKFNRLQANQPRFSHLVNPVLSARDTVRFTPGYQRLSTPPSTPTVFLHDVGHYLSCGEVARLFDEFPAMQRLMFSAILPEEVMLGEPSWHPSLYRLEHLDADSYSYILSEDGESYEQPYSTLEWLTTKSITAPAGRLSVEVIHRKFSHKLFVVTRAEALVPRDWWVCDSPDDVVLPHVDGRILRHSSQRVPRTIFQSVLLHSMSLSTQRLSSTIAKVRTFSS
nr:viral RNA methyltransferase [Fusarium graminearum mycotymovirus 1]